MSPWIKIDMNNLPIKLERQDEFNKLTKVNENIKKMRRKVKDFRIIRGQGYGSTRRNMITFCRVSTVDFEQVNVCSVVIFCQGVRSIGFVTKCYFSRQSIFGLVFSLWEVEIGYHTWNLWNILGISKFIQNWSYCSCFRDLCLTFFLFFKREESSKTKSV